MSFRMVSYSNRVSEFRVDICPKYFIVISIFRRGSFSYSADYKEKKGWTHTKRYSSSFSFPARWTDIQKDCACQASINVWVGPKIGFIVWGLLDISSQVKAGQ